MVAEGQRPLLSILVVDDDISAANALGRLLRSSGHNVHVTYSSLEGLEIARQVRPDLILHDILMPEVDGYDAARLLRAEPSLAGTLLIACSGSVDEATARQAGFEGWLTKPLAAGEIDTVLALVEQRLNQNASSHRNDALDDAPT